VVAHRGSELVEHDPAAHTGVRGEPQQVAGTVVDPGEDLDSGAIRELEVSEVRLPALVREVGFEPSI